jgi:N-acetylmuramoyl-L-alanine amidase
MPAPAEERKKSQPKPQAPEPVVQQDTATIVEQPVAEEPQLEVKPIQTVQPVTKPDPQPEAKPVTKPEPKPEVKPVAQPVAEEAPVFKVQILVSSSRLRSTDARFKGLSGVASYQEGGMFKYTVGSSTDYQEIYQLRKSIVDKFPQAFIVAFKDGVRMDVNEARKIKVKK